MNNSTTAPAYQATVCPAESEFSWTATSFEPEDLKAFAQEYYNLGLGILPCHHGTKVPAVTYRIVQERGKRLPWTKMLSRLFDSSKGHNIGVMLGKSSRGICMRDFDTLEAYEAFANANPELAASLPTSKTRRGRHVFFRCNPAHLDSLMGRSEIVMFDDGELKRGGIGILPPSLHPKGGRYEWLIPPSVGFPLVTDLVASGLYSPQSESEAAVTRLEGVTQEVLLACSLPNSLTFDLKDCQDLDEILKLTVPTKHGQRRHCIFVLVRLLKGFHKMHGGSVKDFIPIFYRWYELALPFIGTKDWKTNERDFREMWQLVRSPAGASLDAICADLTATGKDRLAQMFERLDAYHKGGSFPLGCRIVADKCGVSYKTAAKWLRQYLRAGVICMAKEAITHMEGKSVARRFATEYRFVGELPSQSELESVVPF
jgi:hypothetical protein